jgi:hypothetical protein
MINTLSNDSPTDPAIRGDEVTISFQTAKDWTSGFDSVTIQSRKNGKSLIAAKRMEAFAGSLAKLLELCPIPP